MTYTPNDDQWTGIDYFEYSVCAEEYPQTCDVALVTIKIIKCEDIAVEAGENIVKGRVFLQLLPEDGNYDGDEDLIPDIKVDLYADLNHNGVIDAGDELLESAYTDLTGRFNFRTRGNDFAADDFGSSESYSLNSGTKNWSNNWIRSNTTLVASVVDAVPDNVGNRAMRISGASSYASRSLTFTNATGAAVKFSYRRDLANQNNRALTVSLNSHTIYTIVGEDGDGKDLFYEEVIANIPFEYINSAGSNTLEFTTNSHTSNNDYFYIDNVELIYFPANFVVKISESNQTYLPSEQLNEVSYYFNGLGNCSGNRYLAVIANMEAMDDEVYVTTDTPTKIEILKNDLGNPDPSSIVITEQPTNGTLVINPDGTVTYFPNPGYDGNDSFKYTVCSIEDPNVCSDVATVSIHVQCTHVPGKNVINGMVFGDVDLNGDFDAGERGISGMQVELYDGADNLLQTTTTCEEGCYQFEIDCPTLEKTYLDEFNTNSSGSGSDGTENWTGSPWTEIGESNGFGSANIYVTGNRLRINGNGATSQIGAQRSANLTGALSAILTFSYVKNGFDNNNDWVEVEVATSPTGPFTRLAQYAGTSNTSGSANFDISDYISPTTTIRFRESSSSQMTTSDYMTFDDVQIKFDAYDASATNTYTVKLASPLEGYELTTAPEVYTIALTGCSDASCSNNFGLGASDLGVQKLVDKDEPLIGDTITFSIIVTNHGPSNNTGVVAVDELPSGYQFISQNKGSAFNQATGAWDIGVLDVHKSDTLEIVVEVLETGEYVNTATVTGDLLDPNPGNSTGTSTVSPEPWTDLELEKLISSDPISESVPFTYTIKLTNHGPSKATDIKVQDILDDGYNVLNVATSIGSWEEPLWSIASMDSAATATMTITAVVPMFSGIDSIANTATVTTDTYEKNHLNNSATVKTEVLEFAGNYWYGTIDSDWSKTDNWTANEVPDAHEDIEFATEDNWGTSAVRDLHLDADRIIGDLINDSDVDLIITQGNQLIIEGEVKDDNDDNGTIVIKAGEDDDNPANSVASGTLIFDDPSKNTAVQATVEFYNQAYDCDDCGFYRKQWQYFGIPINEAAFPYQDPIAEIVNQWVETYNGNKWQSAPYAPDTKLQAFKGYEITNTGSTLPDHVYAFSGTLNVGDANLSLTKTGNVNYSGTHILANSFTAALPIDDYAIAYDKDWTETVYLFNTGTRDQWRKTNGTLVPHNTRAGQYKAVPIHLAGEAGLDDHIPSMHSFLIQVKEAGTLTLKYDALQKNTLVDGKAWRVVQEKPELPYIVIDIMGGETADRVWLFENPATTTGFDKGWDALKMAETDIAQIYVNNEKQNYQVATVPEMEGTLVGLQPFNEDLYTISITSNDMVNMRNLYLYDTQTGSMYSIQDELSHPISVKAGNDKRFMIVSADFEPKREIAVKVINKRIIISNPVNGTDQWAYLYSLTGDLMDRAYVRAGETHTMGEFTPLQLGAYVLSFKDEEGNTESHKVILK